jgi:hypothetical protein
MYSSLNSFSSIHTKQLTYVMPSVKSIAVGTTKTLSPAFAQSSNQQAGYYTTGGMSSDEQWIFMFAYTGYSLFSTDGGLTWQLFHPI